MIEFFSPVSTELIDFVKTQDKQVLGHKILKYDETNAQFPNVNKGDVVFFGVLENRNNVKGSDDDFQLTNFRKSLYKLFSGNWNKRLIDLGDIQPGNTVSDTYYALQNVVCSIIKLGAFPIVLGGSQDLTYAMYRSYDQLDQMVSLVSVDSRFDLRDMSMGVKSNNYVNNVIIEEPNNLINFTNLGFQTYFNSQEEIDLMDKLYFESYRLGDVVNNLSVVEPVMRDADSVSFDITSIKAAELSSSNFFDSPNGFDGREACTISRYAGMSNKITSFGLFELSSTMSTSGFMLAAQIVWYFIEGLHCRVNEYSFSSDNHFKKYFVPLEEFDLLFYESLISKRWWVKMPDIDHKDNKYQRLSLLPCTHEDYLVACNQQIPERIFKAFRKKII